MTKCLRFQYGITNCSHVTVSDVNNKYGAFHRGHTFIIVLRQQKGYGARKLIT